MSWLIVLVIVVFFSSLIRVLAESGNQTGATVLGGFFLFLFALGFIAWATG